MSQITAVQQESYLASPSTLISLYILDGTAIGFDEILYFVDGQATSYQSLVFNSQSYLPFPIITKGMTADGQGKVSRPSIIAANINGFVSNLLLPNGNLVGAKIIRRRVFARFLDAVNFVNGINPYGAPNPSAAYPDEIWIVNRKIKEDQQQVEWEMASPIELDGIRLPRRQITATVCGFIKYRDPDTCGYNGLPVADRNGKLFVGGAGTYGFTTLTDQGEYDSATTYNAGDFVNVPSPIPQFSGLPVLFVCLANGTVGNQNSPINNPSLWVQDACPKSLGACKLRFPNQPLRYGGFPGVSTAPYIVSS